MYFVNYYLDLRNKFREKHIRLWIRINKKTLKFNTGDKIEEKYWDQSKQQAKRTYIGHPELNTYLQNLKVKVENKLRSIKIENDIVTLQKIKDEIGKIFELQKPTESKRIFFDSLRLFIEAKKTEASYRTIQKYHTLISHLEYFENDYEYILTFESIDSSFYEKFTEYLIKELKLSNNTIGKYMSTLKTFLSWAVDKKLTDNLEYRKFKVYDEKTDIIILTFDELMKIYTLDFTGNSKLDKVKDVFLFQCFTGQRFSDIENLQRKDIKNDSWYLRTYKTRDIIEIPLTEYAMEILKKYEKNEKPLPIITQQKTNDYIKQICKIAGIDEPVTIVRYRGSERLETVKPKYEFVSTHTARRTFVTISLLKGMNPETIKEITGHKNHRTFQKYIKITSDVKKKEMNKFWNKSANLKLVNF